MPNIPSESRSHKRYKVKEKVIALAFDDVCRLSDISMGGAALNCIGGSDLPPKWSIEIMMAGAHFHATIPVKLIWEDEAEPSLPATLFTRRIGVQFDELTKENKEKIDHLINLHEEYAV